MHRKGSSGVTAVQGGLGELGRGNGDILGLRNPRLAIWSMIQTCFMFCSLVDAASQTLQAS